MKIELERDLQRAARSDRLEKTSTSINAASVGSDRFVVNLPLLILLHLMLTASGQLNRSPGAEIDPCS